MTFKSKSNELSPMLLALYETSHQLIAIYDEKDVLQYANPAFIAAIDGAPDGHTTWADMMRASYTSGRGVLIETADFEHWLASATSRRGKQAYRAFEADLADGRWVWMTETVNKDGWMLSVASDITDLKQDERELRVAHKVALRASQTDTLTGISNRRHVFELLAQALEALNNQNHDLCVAIFDLDHFKSVNDNFGHKAGDTVLCDFAINLQQSSRRQDGCGRIGGEEFVLILPEVSLPDGKAMITRFLSQIRLSRPLKDTPSFGYTASVGLAAGRKNESANELMNRADAALYAAKAAGRDNLQIADEC